MAKPLLRRLLDKLRRPDQEDNRPARPVPIDPATIEARRGNVDALAGLSPSIRIERDSGEDRR